MSEYLIKWNNVRTVWTKITANTEKDAIRNLLAGKGTEVDWCGSDTPDSKKDIEEITKQPGVKYGRN